MEANGNLKKALDTLSALLKKQEAQIAAAKKIDAEVEKAKAEVAKHVGKNEKA